VKLRHGTKAILSDTVGFISDLPTMLVAAFRATLEEVIEADVILHVRDVSHEDAEAQLRDVENVLRSLGIEQNDKRLIEVWNKLDRLPPEARVRIENLADRQDLHGRPVLVSALTGEGVDRLTDAIEQRLATHRVEIDLVLDPADGAGASWLYRNTEVLEKSLNPDGALAMRVRADPSKLEQVKAKFAAPTH
jgi:GTP-binding protein HflX